MADTHDTREREKAPAPRRPPSREHEAERPERAPPVARPVPDFEEVAADDELGSDENQLDQRRTSRCDEED